MGSVARAAGPTFEYAAQPLSDQPSSPAAREPITLRDAYGFFLPLVMMGLAVLLVRRTLELVRMAPGPSVGSLVLSDTRPILPAAVLLGSLALWLGCYGTEVLLADRETILGRPMTRAFMGSLHSLVAGFFLLLAFGAGAQAFSVGTTTVFNA